MSEVRRGYKQTEVGVIPEDWGVQSVGNAFEICNELRLPISRNVRAQMAGEYPYYGPTAIQGWINEYRVEGEYALIGEDGDHFLKWQTNPMTLLVQGKFNVNNHAHLVRGTKNTTSWFFWFFAHRDLTQFLTRQGAGRYKLTKAVLQRIPCALPPTPAEQTAIAEALSDADALIESLEQLLTKKRQIKQGAMQELLTGKKRLPGFQSKPGYKQTEVGVIPEDWEVLPLGDHSQIFGRIGFRGYTVDDIVEEGNGALAINPSNIREGRMVFEKCTYVSWKKYEESPEIKVDDGDVILVKTGSTVGKTAQVKSLPYKATLNPQVVVFKNVKGSRDYFAYLMSTPLVQNQIVTAAVGGALPTLSQKLVAAFKCPLPGLPEQTAIATVLSDMDADITALETKLTKARQIKQGMIQNLLTGKIRLV